MESIKDTDNLIYPHQSLSSFEMGRDDVNVVCTYGKISVWFGRQVPDIVVGKTLIGISNVDPSTVHEYDLICDFEQITQYESQGYILVSYARTGGGRYRSTFNIPFSSKKALFHLAESITKELKDKNVNIDLYWTGDDADIMRLHGELSSIDGWKLKNINYKDDGKDKTHPEITLI